MPAYMICDVSVKDRERLSEYLSLSSETLAAYGGRFLAQAGKTDVIEGEWNPRVIIIAEFPDMESARKWYHSKEYEPALRVKPLALERNMIVVNGIEQDT